MRFPSDAPVTPAKLDALRARIATLGIALEQVDEQFIRSSGPGGQKVNKTSSGVRLGYAIGGTPIAVKWTRERHRALNRFLALRELVDEVEARVSPGTSARVDEAARRHKQKGRARRRRAARDAAPLGAPEGAAGAEQSGTGTGTGTADGPNAAGPTGHGQGHGSGDGDRARRPGLMTPPPWPESGAAPAR